MPKEPSDIAKQIHKELEGRELPSGSTQWAELVQEILDRADELSQTNSTKESK